MRWNHCLRISMSFTIKPVGDPVDFDQWCATYKPIPNHLSEESIDYFETYGMELGYVLGVADCNPNRVWTYVDGDRGTYLINGYHLVNRIYYMICEVPYEGKDIEVCVSSDEHEECEDA